jgi:bifunctional non-homologous end joining protein LigD
VPDGRQWVHEIKHDGYRFICWRHGDRVRLFTRRGHDWTDRLPRVTQAIQSLRAISTTIDGEVVVCDRSGVTDFDRLRSVLACGGSNDAFLFSYAAPGRRSMSRKRQNSSA